MNGCGREIGGLPCCTVIHGDCDEYLWQLPAGCVDLVVTDSPYGMSFVSGARKEKYDAIVGDDRLPVETIQQLIQSHGWLLTSSADGIIFGTTRHFRNRIAWLRG